MKKALFTTAVLCCCANPTGAQMTPLLPGTENEVAQCLESRQVEQINFLGMDATVTQTVARDASGKCRVEITTDSDLLSAVTTCRLNDRQLEEIRKANADDGGETYTAIIPMTATDRDGTPVGNSEMSVSGTLQEVTWARFLNDPAVCTVKTAEKDATADFIAALADCRTVKRKFDVSGFKATLELMPAEDQLCRYAFAIELPTVTLTVNDEERRLPPRSVQVDCKLNSQRQQELAQWFETGEPYRYRFDPGIGEQGSVTLMIPQEWAENSEICTVTRP